MLPNILKFEDYEINIKYKKMKYARLKVDKESNIYLSLPLRFPDYQALNFIKKNETWIQKTITKNKNRALPKDKTYLKGVIYTLKFDENFKRVEVANDTILAPNLEIFMKFKKEFAKKEFMKFIEIYKPLVKKDVNRVVVRDMKTRWGSCNSKKGYINLALKLIEKSPDIIEYVVLHELTHLIYPHHQKSFYDFIKKIMPDYKDREKKLKY
ncbi:peptidase, M48 family (DUF45 domain) [Campylobacter blaseri]|uniref:YgjP-like metallopeptidase domain-containing protein n=1 Tax=Campylobacter blaseri TaxID=2042961 RepID=A0A2P8QZT7_9BACT|nr:YgjP-like metallopeptidase domain-containing protein [Campylobacter blaseri]PSM51750.1 hypothetical protein CQ405_06370 [Campylobacter blaseri]PSM53541.1 hypothetical protein CRN67_06375 [Campylobacter blaseri]QKF86348.1 peptidase, M48 family (DUF45 domain) [Campylobacter blaseri]